MKSTLLLNSDYSLVTISPISTISWKDAVRLKYLGTVDVLNEYDEWTVRSPSISMRVPSVVKLRKYAKFRRNVTLNRRNVFIRDSFKCQYCKQKFPTEKLTWDHVVPKSKGGGASWNNLVTACYACNTRKSDNDMPVPESDPYQPSFTEIIAKTIPQTVQVYHKSWVPYISYLWKIENMEFHY